jgi:hypothetical protein
MKVTKNTVAKGLNADIDFAITPPENYVGAWNLCLTGDNKFYALTNIQGTEEVAEIISSFSGRVMGVYAVKFKIGDLEGIESLLIFVSENDTLKILAYDLENSDLYQLYEESFDGYDVAGTLIDAVIYPEQNITNVYFTDNFSEIKKLRCEIPLPYVANFIAPEEISLQRRGTIATLSLNNIITGGSLLCGSYQFCLRFYNEERKSYTKWTIPSSPYNITQTSSTVGLGSYNAVSNKYISLRVDVPDEEFELYTHYQLAVIENTQAVNSLNASLLKLEELVIDSQAGGLTTFYPEYKSNDRINFVPIADIVVDLAAIDHVKTLQVKNNKLFAGNVTYTNLEYDNGGPVATGSIQRVTVSNIDDFQTSTRRGMWRDEVYRYYVSYYDDKGNYSRPKMLDMSSIANNQISNGDLRTPTNKVQNFTLLDSSNNTTNLNLSLTIDNHPSWARGFVILRAKRKARIKFQTPFVPSSLIEGVDVIGNYPTLIAESDGAGGASAKDIPGATPMNPVGTHVPKNYFFPIKRDYIKVVNNDSGIGLQKGEVKAAAVTQTTSSNKIWFVFPPNVYNTGIATPYYTHVDGDKFETIDFAFLRLKYESFQDNDVNGTIVETNIGNFLDTSVSGTFYATQKGDYYYSTSTSRPTPVFPNQDERSGKIISYKELSNLGEGTQIGGNSVGEFVNLTTGGVTYNTSPNNQAMGMVQLDINKFDSTYYARPFTYQIISASGSDINSNFFELTEGEQSNTFTPNKSGWGTGSHVSLVDIVNIVTEQGDDRYGDPEDLHDMVFTGASYSFTSSERAAIEIDGTSPITLSVAGGDCYTSIHQFKLTDSHYGMLNIEKTGAGTQLSEGDLLKRWEKSYYNVFDDGGSSGKGVMCMPVPYRNCSQVLAIVLESEVNGAILAPRVYPIENGVQFEDDNEYNLRTPFTYIYNANYSNQSNQKAFIPFDPDETIVTQFKSRGLFSDQKIYNTFEEGFDIFRTSSTFDLEETYGGITKLVLSGDELYALQEKATVYLPVDAQITETADGQVISLRSSVTVDIPRYISRQYGCQHIKGVSQIDSAIFFPDNFNKAVLRFEGGQLNLISEVGMIKNFQSLMEAQIDEQYLLGIYDNKRRQYWMVSTEPDNLHCWIWDDRLKCWISDYEFPSLQGGVYTQDEVYLLGGELNLWKMYSGDYNNLMDTTVTPRVEFSINPEFEIAKTFDDLVIYSSDELATADMETMLDSGTNQQVLGMILDVNREGNYRIPTLRDSNSGRLRGLRALLTLYWNTTNNKVSLNSVATKYRDSQRMI